tara:strand:+ start:196 stop:696 length:501 start_codon:yes stop_codon:yes gene_type:complete
MNGVEINKNFLDKDFFQELKKLIIESEFSWFKRETMVIGTKNNLGYFTHSFYNNHKINCDTYFKYILPILDKLNSKAVIEVRANLTPSVFFKEKKCDFHTDNSFNCKTAILYLNTCDGGTEFKIDNKIQLVKSEENKIVIFNSNIEHRAITSTNADFRYIINFNYF